MGGSGLVGGRHGLAGVLRAALLGVAAHDLALWSGLVVVRGARLVLGLALSVLVGRGRAPAWWMGDVCWMGLAGHGVWAGAGAVGGGAGYVILGAFPLTGSWHDVPSWRHCSRPRLTGSGHALGSSHPGPGLLDLGGAAGVSGDLGGPGCGVWGRRRDAWGRSISSRRWARCGHGKPPPG